MYFTVEEENLICLYHNADRRRTAAFLFLSICPHLEPRFKGNRITLSNCLPTMRKNP